MGRQISSSEVERPCDRLKRARLAANYKHMSDFIRAHDLSEPTYRSHENGTRPLTVPAAKQYAKLLTEDGVPVDWLYLMEGIAAQLPQGRQTAGKPKGERTPGFVEVPEYDVRVSAGGGFYISDETRKDIWPFSRRYLADELRLNAQGLAIVEVVGDSMEPTLRSGDRVLVNTADRRLSQPGLFVLWDGDGTVVKRLEIVPGTEPVRVLRISDNPHHRTHEVMAEQVSVVGRVVWVARRL